MNHSEQTEDKIQCAVCIEEFPAEHMTRIGEYGLAVCPGCLHLSRKILLDFNPDIQISGFEDLMSDEELKMYHQQHALQQATKFFDEENHSGN